MCVKESITIIHNLLGDNCLLILTVVMVSWVYKDIETDQQRHREVELLALGHQQVVKSVLEP